MPNLDRCACCSSELEPVQELRYLVECANLNNPEHLARIRRLPSINGKPVPVCQACQIVVEAGLARTRVKASPVRTGVLAAIGLLSVGWLVHNLLMGSRS